jgi:hypothetical protein
MLIVGYKNILVASLGLVLPLWGCGYDRVLPARRPAQVVTDPWTGHHRP